MIIGRTSSYITCTHYITLHSPECWHVLHWPLLSLAVTHCRPANCSLTMPPCKPSWSGSQSSQNNLSLSWTDQRNICTMNRKRPVTELNRLPSPLNKWKVGRRSLEAHHVGFILLQHISILLCWKFCEWVMLDDLDYVPCICYTWIYKFVNKKLVGMCNCHKICVCKWM